MAGQQFNIDLNLTSIGGGMGGGFGTLHDQDGSTTAVAKFLSPLGSHVNKISTNFATLGAATTKLVGGFQFLFQSTNALIGKMMAFSPDLQRASAINQIRDVQQNLRLARESGPELAKLALAQGDMSRKIEEQTTKILMAFAPLLNKILDNTAGLIDGAIEVKNTVGKAMDDAGKGYGMLILHTAKMLGMLDKVQAFAHRQIAADQEKAAKEAARQAIEMQNVNGFFDPDQVDKFWNIPKTRVVPAQPDVSGFFDR